MDDPPVITACYRHPGRPAGVRCQRCSRAICADCMVSAPVGFQCPECVATASHQARQVMTLGGGVPYLTYAIVAANVVVALAGLITTPRWVQGDLGTIGLHGGLIGGGVVLKGNSLSPIGVNYGEWYRVFTGAFIHAGPVHLGFNMLLLWQTGSLLEPALGRARFGMLYIVSLLGGSFGALLAAPHTITVGASGAVFGLMGALFLAERAGQFQGRRSAVGFLIVINLALSVAIPGISIGGHIGGLLAGGATGWLFHEFERRKLPLVPVAMSFVLAATLFVGSLWAASLWMAPLF
jgi:membrane associated rhomboid family serine protease